jgi:hypothetical protein
MYRLAVPIGPQPQWTAADSFVITSKPAVSPNR